MDVAHQCDRTLEDAYIVFLHENFLYLAANNLDGILLQFFSFSCPFKQLVWIEGELGLLGVGEDTVLVQ